MAKKPKNDRVVAENRKARHDYTIEDTLEAGLVLTGTEVKSLRDGRCNLRDAHARIKNGEVWVHQVNIGLYPFAYYGNHEPMRPRKLLLHRHEIRKLYAKANEQGYTLIPLKVYFKAGKAKLLLAVARGKRKYDKRESIRRRDEERNLDRLRKHYGVK